MMQFGENWMKIVLAGDEGVGKTCIIHSLIQHRFVDGFHSTVGASVHDWTANIGNESIDVKIWDTAGQERYRSLAPVYFRGAAAVIIVFDATNSNPLQGILDWASAFREATGPNELIMVAANKVDLLDDRTQLMSIVLKIKEELDIDVFEVSAKTGENILELFQNTTSILSKRNPKQMFSSQPLNQTSKKDDGCC